MGLFKIEKENLKEIYEKPFRIERKLQDLCEKNLEKIFGLRFVDREFQVKDYRIDTLGFDPKSRSFVIIEYKREKNKSVVDQGYAYLSVMLNNEANFILKYNEKFKKPLKQKDVDWTQSKVMFVSPSFTKYQLESISFKDLPIELWKATRYDNNTIQFTHLEPSGATASIKTISKQSKSMETVSKKIKIWTEDDHLSGMPEEIKELYQKFKDGILNLGDDITIKPTKLYIGFTAQRNIADIRLQKRSIKIWINLRIGELDDPKGLAKDVSNVGHWGNGHYEIQVGDDENLEYILSLIKQSYKNGIKKRSS